MSNIIKDDIYTNNIDIQSDKTIDIFGTINRNKIKKSVNSDNYYKKQNRLIIKKWTFPEKCYEYNYQKYILSNINTLIEQIDIKVKNKMISEINNKINSYKQQDIIKNRFDETLFVNFDSIIKILLDNNICCHYCSIGVFILYKIARENTQWTIDRIDNDIGHNKNNIVISCLKCNLERRRTHKDKFIFTKQLIINKCDK
jgi:hypothetical protein